MNALSGPTGGAWLGWVIIVKGAPSPRIPGPVLLLPFNSLTLSSLRKLGPLGRRRICYANERAF